MSIKSLLRVSYFALFSFGFAADAAALNPEWQWRVNGHAPTFPTKTAAVAYMQSLTSIDPRYALLTVERKVPMITESEERYQYEGPKVDPDTTPWMYTDGLWGGPWFSSEEAYAADRLGKLQDPAGCPDPSLTPASEWITTSNGHGGLPRRQDRTYAVKVYAPGSCNEQNWQYTAIRERNVSCPSGYLSQPPGCWLNFIGTIIGTRNYCEGICGRRGNPGDAVTGDKFETALDYTGPGGLQFERYYHSRSLDATNGLGIGWSHKYQPRVVAFNTTYALVRPNGYRESATSSSSWITRNGTVFRQVGSEWKVYLSDGSIETYNGSGRLTSIHTPGSGTTTLAYSADLLQSVTGPFGHALQFEYDGTGRLARVRTPSLETIEFGYTGENLTSVTYPDATSRTYHYEETGLPNHLTGITDESGTRFATYDYDTTGRIASSEHAGSVGRYAFAYNATTSAVTDPLNTVETISFTTESSLARRITQVSKPGETQSYTVPSVATDAQRRVSQETDPRGNVTTYTYTTYHVTSKTEASGTPAARTTAYQYLSNDSDLPTLITEGSRTTAFTYHSTGGMLTKTITDTATSESRTWTWTRDSYGRPLTEDGPRTDISDVTTYTFYGAAATCTATVTGASTTGCRGQLETVTNALSHVTTLNEYNAHGQPLTITDPNGVVTTLVYDARQRLTSRSASGESTTFEYWPTGLLKKVTLADASFMLYTYDAAHRLWKIEDGEGNRIEYTLDAMGNRTAENAYDPSSALVRTHTRVFNTLNQLWKDVNAAGTAAVTTVFGYDANGNQTSIAAPLSRTTGQLYDELNRLKQITDPASGVTQFAYDRFDQLTQVTDPRSLATTYTHNNLGDLTQLVSPDTGTTTSTYDSAGNLATRTDARSKTGTYAYDALDRVTSIAYPDQTLSFTYDAGTYGKGHLTGASDANHSLSFTHDALGRVTAKGQTVGAVTKSVAYGYTDGSLTSLVTPSGQTIAYGYADGRVASVTLNGSTTILNQVLHDPFGPVAGWTWGNSTIAARTYDEDGKIEALDSAGATTYGYDDAFRITGITDLDDNSRSWTYGYDLLDRLTSGAMTGQTIGYAYDANGNRLAQTGTQTATYTVSGSSNRVSSITGSPARTYSYDAAGNTSGYGALTFAYADSGRMKSVTDASGTTNYTLNALGQRVKKSGPGGTRLFVYDEAGHLIGEYDASGVLIQETVWMGDIPVATLRPNGAGGVNHFYVHSDHLNTPRRVSRPSDDVILWRWDSDPFGSSAANEDPDGDLNPFVYNLRFPGQYYDSESGLSYNDFRDYDATIGRYVESDPIGLNGGVDTYLYALNDPVQKFDANGLMACDGLWSSQGWDPILPRILRACVCYWLCMPCIGAVVWSGVKESLPTTRGPIIFMPSRPSSEGDVEEGNACACKKPGPEKDCSCFRPRDPEGMLQ